jgi:membrane protein YdbS with pleckstrin-like domain
MFENPEVAVENLPTVDDVEWRQLDPRYVRRLQVESFLTALTIFGGLLVIELLPFPLKDVMSAWLAAATAGLFLARGLAWPAVSVPRKGYAIRSRDILYRSGVLWRSVAAIPFNRVQHVETSHSPLDRRFRLATLKLYTAAGAGGDLKIHGMPADVAERMRVFLLEQAAARPVDASPARSSREAGEDAGHD